MFKSILVPIDGTAQSNVALPLARTVARETGAAITLLRVLPVSDLPAGREAVGEATDTLKRIAKALIVGSDLQAKTVVRQSDDVADEILQQTRAQAADLIIMRTHGRAGLGRAILGSVAERVLAEGRIPVMLLRPGGRRIGQIRTLLVPIDGSPGGAVALGTGVGLAQATSATIKLLEVAVPMPSYAYTTDGYGGMPYFDPAWDEEALASAHVCVDAIVTRLRDAGLIADGEARMEPAVAQTIVAVAEGASADLIVMSTQALTGPARALLGSVADAVVRSSHCPVLLLHRSEADEMPTPAVED